MGSLGLPEIAFIFILALLIFGPKKLPEIGRTLGRGVAEFRKATNELKRSINTELALDENPLPPSLLPRRLEDLLDPPREAPAAASAPAAEPAAPKPSPEAPPAASPPPEAGETLPPA